ncbi:zinc ABC transporter substrate-binding protein AztC [Streptomyces carpaticus]|uniref:Zinc/manganese transport system substrate-binding protein n=1 Tax=Streptomyces harbinensis TaxID=1176198 RepID=A0A1I6TF54_9ACTN|nr:zinc ABC transporter substrate-binding protein AztC [Streptomyces harbinensis]UWM49907.1 zinc ABC transporter substrate-binding protein AztC [Streptomyces carpaticus]SFS87776.1 zinc/manganese transport system substrate-binding protein [Streptomyces harbinensis]
MRRRTVIGALLGALALPLATTGCSTADDDRAGIVVTTNILGDITQRIAGDQAEVTVLMGAGTDPHSFGISARQAAGIESAALLVYNGLGLEEGVLRHVEAAAGSGTPTLEVGAEIDPLPYTSDAMAGEPDPHFWTDPQRVATATERIADRIIEDVPGVDADRIRENSAAYLAEVGELDAWMTDEFASLPAERRALVTNHHVFGYLADRYGFTVIGAVIPSGTTLASPSASDLESLAGAIREAGVPAIFVEAQQPDRLAQVLAEETGLQVDVVPLFSESLSAPGEGAETYLDLMRSNTRAIVAGLR